jgi:SAM-dependent methyltransferase
MHIKTEMLKKLLSFYKHQQFFPSLISIFINPSYFIRKGLYKSILENAGQLKGKLLDIGCGSKPYKNLFRVNLYIGLDIKNSSHSHTDESIDVYYNGRSFPFKDEQFDSAFSSEVFEHIFELDEVLREINRVMKKNGLALFSVPFVWDEHEIPFDFGRYTEFGIRYLLEKNDFNILEIKKDTNFIETIFQLWILYLFYKLYTNNKYLNILINTIFISPFTIIGIIISKIFPKNYKLYHNNIILAKKN